MKLNGPLQSLARRRSYALLVDHMVPPAMDAGLQEDARKTLHDDIHKFNTLEPGLLREEFRKRITTQVQAEHIHEVIKAPAAETAYPDEVIALDDRIAAHAQLRRDHVLPRDLCAFARRVVADAVIHAAHAVAFAATLRQQRTPVRTAVVKRDDLAAVAAIEQDVVPEQRAGEHTPVDQLVVPGCDIPAVA